MERFKNMKKRKKKDTKLVKSISVGIFLVVILFVVIVYLKGEEVNYDGDSCLTECLIRGYDVGTCDKEIKVQGEFEKIGGCDENTACFCKKESLGKECVGIDSEDVQGCCDKWADENNIFKTQCTGKWEIENVGCSWVCYIS